jgi:hypothetical protein
MDGNYVFLCGVTWCRFGQQEAGKELLRATNSLDPDMKALAWAMLAKGARRLRDLERATPTGSRAILEGNLCLQSTLTQAPIVRVRALSMRMGLVGPSEPES